MEYDYMDPEYVPRYAQKSTDMSVGAWLGTLILSGIPIVGLICLIVWAVSSSPDKRSRKNWAIAQFIIVFFVLIVTIALCLVFGSTLGDMLKAL